MALAFGLHFNIDSKFDQRIVPPSPSKGFEGIAFSRSGNIMAVAAAETNCILLFRRKADGRFEDVPFHTLGREPDGLDYPHDVAFSNDDTELLAIAQRTRGIAIYQKNSDKSYAYTLAFKIGGSQSKLAYSDGVAFVPPKSDYLAACNLELRSVVFFRRLWPSAIAFEQTPEFELRHPSVFNPDGLGFSCCGRWLATANHGKHTVSLFQRRNRMLPGGKLIYGPEPVTVIEDPGLRYPHSVAFTPRTNCLVVTNAGANYFNTYRPQPHYLGIRWSQSPMAQVVTHDYEVFHEVNTANEMEGGPKGVAISNNSLAVCSPQIGVKLYSIREQP